MTWTAGAGPRPAPRPASPPALRPASPSVLPAVPPPLPRKLGTRGILFTVLVAVALFLGAIVIALVFFASGKPDAIAIGFLLAILPVGPLVACYLWLDRYEPEPLRLLLLSFLWGALAATSVALILQSVEQVVAGPSDALTGVVVAPLTEEGAKGVFVLLLLWSRRNVIDGVLDGLVYAGLVGIGFAFVENILYFAGAYTGGPRFGSGGIGAATGLFVVRGVFSPFAHPLFTSMTGIGVGIAVITRRRWLRIVAPIVGYLVAVALHASWNASAFLGGGQAFLLTYVFAMVPGFSVLVGLAIWFRVREGAMLGRSLTDLAYRGYLQPAEVPWLAKLPARRQARKNAARGGGPLAERLMKDYQHQAIELATLHNRVLRGTAPRDYQQRGAQMAQRLWALRMHLLGPQNVVAPSPTPTPLPAEARRAGWA
ncbi:MAG: protease PrsW [Nocardioidaceae bacterium]|nr:protease PrsW [Nocardioidaceae bacterium]